ncbi:MAG TPA: TadE/TadG family type IV pilus assembly protein [Allosphingosinicella sp.]|jgi:Flp pilus assembly protein TadG
MIREAAPRHGGILRDERGVSVIEMAFLVPILAFMLLGMVDLANGYTRKMAVENAVNRAMEKVAVLPVQDDYTFIKTEITTALPSVTAASITVDPYSMCDTTKNATFKTECGFRADGTAQEIQRYVRVKVAHRWTPTFNYGAFGHYLFKAGSDGKVPLNVETQLRVQ